MSSSSVRHGRRSLRNLGNSLAEASVLCIRTKQSIAWENNINYGSQYKTWESAKRLAAAGAQVFLMTRSNAWVSGGAGPYATNESPSKASYNVLNLDCVAAIKEAGLSWTADLPTIDVLLNNAAVLGGSELALSQTA